MPARFKARGSTEPARPHLRLCPPFGGSWSMRALTALCIAGTAVALVTSGCGSSSVSSPSSTTASVKATGGSSSSRKPFTVGFMILSQNQFFTSEAADLRKRLAAVGGKLEVLNPNGDPEMQLQQAETAINTGTVNALMGSLVGIDSFQPALALATKKHIPVVLITFQPKELLEGQTNVALNYTAWGALGAKAMVQCLRQREGGDGSLAVVTWPGYSNIAQRIGGG